MNIPDRVKYSVIDEVVSFAHSMVEEKDAHHDKEEEEDKKMVFPIVVECGHRCQKFAKAL